jgi:hypothetical protein
MMNHDSFVIYLIDIATKLATESATNLYLISIKPY